MQEVDIYDGGWEVAEDRPSYLVKKTVNKRKDGSVRSYVTSYRPILTEEERERRMKLIAEAAANLLLNLYEAKARKTAQKAEENNKD